MSWTIDRIINQPENKPWDHGYGHYCFHDRQGHCYFFHYLDHWVGRLGENDEFVWTAGAKAETQAGFHIDVDLQNPIFLTEAPDGKLLISCTGNGKIYHIDPVNSSAKLFLDARALGIKDISSTVCDCQGNLWISEITGCRIWHLDPTGHVIEVLGNGEAGFQSHDTAFERARFGWIYIMRLGPDGHIYVLDSTNFAVRRLNLPKLAALDYYDGRLFIPEWDGDLIIV